ncbi:MAG TPA: GFA family protein [Verrucomicrobiae bacterium]|nr:GFA family protein [Verrucomicrobiae bacterium]
MSKRIAACSCGQLTAITTEDPIRVSICHCTDCQRRTGSVFGAQARFRRASVEIKGQSTQYVRVSDDGGKAIFSFCPQCGSIVYYQLEGREDAIAIPVGAFADPGFPAPTVSVWEEDKHSWVCLPEDMEHMA